MVASIYWIPLMPYVRYGSLTESNPTERVLRDGTIAAIVPAYVLLAPFVLIYFSIPNVGGIDVDLGWPSVGRCVPILDEEIKGGITNPSCRTDIALIPFILAILAELAVLYALSCVLVKIPEALRRLY